MTGADSGEFTLDVNTEGIMEESYFIALFQDILSNEESGYDPIPLRLR